jgi:hypothetical protein
MSRRSPYAPRASHDDAPDDSQFGDLPFDAELDFNDDRRPRDPLQDLVDSPFTDLDDDADMVDEDDLYGEDYL